MHTITSRRNLVFGFLLLFVIPVRATQGERPARAPSATITRVPVQIERHQAGAPITFGVPFPKGALDSPDHVRVLDGDGREVPSQVNDVSSWRPADPSVKWIWVFFFAGEGRQYTLEFGPDVHRAPLTGPRIVVVNNQRSGGWAEVTTGPLRFDVLKGESAGFLHEVSLDRNGDGFSADEIVATGPAGRGSFLDLVNDEGPDGSTAFVRRTMIEQGSGPLHTIIRVDGEYRYAKPGHEPAPFVTRIHAYAGRTYIKVDHTFVFTGVPDKHRQAPGEHEHIATRAGTILPEDPSDEGWTQPKDRLAAAGLALDLKTSAPGLQVRSAIGSGRWWETGERPLAASTAGAVSLLQTGPKPNRIPPVPESSPTTRIDGFNARLSADGRTVASGDRAPGWLAVSDGRQGFAMAMPRFLEEYPKELRVEAGRATAFIWSPAVEPMSFARWSSELDREEGTTAIENNAQGIAKTTEAAFDFFAGAADASRAHVNLGYFLAPPVAHADPAWYGASGVFGRFAPRSDRFPAFQRALDDKFEWMLFNQRWAPWYGMWDYGDWKLYFDGRRWTSWGNNEPAEDFMCWLQFMRTGDPRLYDAARANSRHSMDVDNLHWPSDPVYLGDTNSSLDYWTFAKQPKGSPYVGIGSRHAQQHWVRTLSAHVWVEGWLADYYLSADHRGLDVAIQTAELHLRRIWGEHGLTGRRLYLSLWNVLSVYDATKDERYLKDAEDRVARILRLQNMPGQGGSLTVDRYGYADVYVSHALDLYLDLTGDARVAEALARHARRMRDVPPYNHEMESYLSSVYSLVLGFRLTREPSLFAEMAHRIETLRMDPLPRPFTDNDWTQASLFEALEKASHLPREATRRSPNRRPIWSATNGLRVFGWTHMYTLPYAMALMEEEDR